MPTLHAGFDPNRAEKVVHVQSTTPKAKKAKKKTHHPVAKVHRAKRLKKITHRG